jgi:type IV pilus assembly protein PilE
LKINRKDRSAGFTLIELMIVVAIVGILAAIALPSYKNYVLRGKIVDATNKLSSLRARMEQYYQDNRTYANGCSVSTNDTSDFAFSCGGVTASAYKITATGQGALSGFTYTIDQSGNMATTALPSTWGSTSTECWITRAGGTC